MLNSVVTHFQEGGLFMWFILVFALCTVGFAVERYLSLYARVKSVPTGFRKQILDYVANGDFRGAENFAQNNAGSTALGRITALGAHLRANAAGDEEVQARMDEKLAQEVSRIDRRTAFLGMFGNVATLLGLLGTIVGMIGSFAAVSAANPSERATMLSKGISEAMNCTAFGLLTAIPALVAFAVFQNRTDRLVTELTESATEIYHDLLFLTDSQPAAKTGKSSRSAAPSMEV